MTRAAKELSVVNYIQMVRREVPNAKLIFGEYRCRQFAVMLSNMFGGEVWSDENHCITRIGDKFYDINGEAKPDKHLPCRLVIRESYLPH